MGRTKTRLSSIELKVYDFVVKYKSANGGNSPSLREICLELGIASTSTSLAKFYLNNLQKAGLITVGPGKSRNIIVTGSTWTLLPVTAGAAQDQ